jgi:hypothetical protein
MHPCGVRRGAVLGDSAVAGGVAVRLPKRIPKTGPVKGRWLAHQNKSKLIVMKRVEAKGGLCEGCGKEPAVDWQHVFGRRHLIAEPWASSPELTMGLCRACHRSCDGDLGGVNKTLRERLRWERFYVLCEATKQWGWASGARGRFGNGLNATRALVDFLAKEAA